MTDTYTASIAGIQLDIETLQDSWEKAVSISEIPYKNGALLDDLGLKARRIKVRCYFYEESYETHKEFLESLKSPGPVEMVHPKYGIIRGMIETVDVRHDERQRTAEIDLGFVEELSGTIEYTRRPDVKSETADAYVRGVTQARDAFADAALADLGAEGWTICNAALDASSSAFSQLTGLSAGARRWVKDIDRFVAGMEAVMVDVANPANSLISSIRLGTDLPGRVVGAVARTAERYSILYQSIRSMPEKFMQNLSDAALDLAQRLGCERDVCTGFSLRAGLGLGQIYHDDEALRDRARALETARSFNARGEYIKPEPTPELLDIGQIEQSLAAANGMIQEAVAMSRSVQALKDMAAILTDHALRIKIESERLTTVYVANETPLHLICLRRGLPYNYAERLVRVNDIPYPNQVKGEVKVYVR